jgi:hypothetical protein
MGRNVANDTVLRVRWAAIFENSLRLQAQLRQSTLRLGDMRFTKSAPHIRPDALSEESAWSRFLLEATAETSDRGRNQIRIVASLLPDAKQQFEKGLAQQS